MLRSKDKKFLVVGLGGMALKHVKALKQLGFQGQVLALRQKSTSSASIDKVLTTWQEVAKEKPDFALVASPSAFHTEQAIALSRLGIPFMMEKPVSSHRKNLSTLKNLVRQKKLATYVCCQLRFDPLLLYVKKKLQATAKPHRIRLYCHSYLPDWRPGRDFKKTYSAQKKLGGGVSYDLIHEFDMVYDWLGLPQKTVGFSKKLSRLPIQSADTCSAILAYPSTLVEISLGYADKNEKRGFELYYENSVIRGDLLTGKLTEEKNGKVTQVKTFERSSETLLKNQMSHFVNVLQKKEKSRNTLLDGIAVLGIIEAIIL